MKLEHEFTVPAPADEAWKVLPDVERIAPCMKVGPVRLTSTCQGRR
jgi:carbon monoxide dehydrogenase subunit G